MPLRVWIGLACIFLAAATYGGWEWWVATRTWVPLDMPISLAEGHIRSSEFTISLDAGFGIFIEESRIFDSDAADCLIGFGDQYCRNSRARPLRASWTLEDSGNVGAQGSTDAYKAWRGGMTSRARGLGDFALPPGKHYVLDVDVLAGGNRFDAGHPRLWIAQSYYWQFEDRRLGAHIAREFQAGSLERSA